MLSIQWIIVICLHGSVAATDSHFSISDVIGTGYDKRVRPSNERYPVNVTLQIDVISLGPLNENRFNYHIDYYERLWWRDERLSFSNTSHASYDEIMLSLPPEKIIWVPAIVVENAIEAKAGDKVRTIISRDGDVFTARRKKLIGSCKMDLRAYPMDKQSCPLIVEDFTFSSRELQLFWHENKPIVLKTSGKKKLEIPGYVIDNVMNKRRVTYYHVGGKMDPFDQLVMFINVTRTFNYYFYRVYIPSILLMVFNMASYWVPDTAVPARVGLIVTTFLTNTFILQSVTESTVQVPYTTALQIFLLGNVVLLVISIIEYLFVLYLKARKKVVKECEKNGAEKTAMFHEASKVEVTSPKHGCDAHIVDQASRIAVPIFYFIFCLSYFIRFMA